MQCLDVFDGCFFWHVHCLGDCTRQERLHCAHHANVTFVVNGVVAHGACKHRYVVRLKVWCTDDRLVLIDVGNDVVDLLSAVTKAAKCTRDCLVDDAHGAATDHLLELHETEVWLNTSGVAVHHEADGAGWCEHRRL